MTHTHLQSLPKTCLLIPGLFLVLLFSFSAPAAAADTSQLQRDLESAPAWSGTNRQNIAAVDQQLISALLPVTKLNEKDARAFIQSYLAGTPGQKLKPGEAVMEGSKIYVLNRLYFEVPVTQPRDRVARFGGWVVPPTGDPATRQVLWPLTKDTSGNLHLTGIFLGYSGPNYNGLAEFDYFRKQFKPRNASGN